MASPFHWVESKIQQLEKDFCLRTLRPMSRTSSATRVMFNGKEYVNFGSNDYLSLSCHPVIVEAVEKELRRSGVGATASRLICGDSPLHQLLENELAEFLGFESALLFSSGYLANLAAVTTILRREDVAIADRDVHASLLDGIKLSQAKLVRFRHNDLNHLESLLSKYAQNKKSRVTVITESVFSMDGSSPSIDSLLDLCSHFGATLILDEAHALGVFGQGRGMLERQPANDFVIKTANLSKALAGAGGFLLCSSRMRELMLSSARSFMFNTALPAMQVQAARIAFKLVRENAHWGRELLNKASFLRDKVRSQGYDVLKSESQIVPCVFNSAEQALDFSLKLENNSILAPAIRHPTVPKGQERIRFSLCLGHTQEDIAALCGLLCSSSCPSRLLLERLFS